jgi:hypothetical protein
LFLRPLRTRRQRQRLVRGEVAPLGAAAAGLQGGADTCSSITLLCRGVDLSQAGPNANTEFSYILGDQLKTNSMFVSTNTGIVGNLVPEGQTFTVQVTVQLKRPLRF